jgi:hypothetical protein
LLVSKGFSTGARHPFARRQAAVWPGSAITLAVLAAVAAPAVANGAYFPTSWGWISLAFGWVALLALLLRRVLLLGRLEYGTLGALVALGGWTALSALWSSSVTQSLLDTERTAVYILGAAAVLLVVTRRRLPALLSGATAGIALVCAYALATRLFPERLAHADDLALNRLARPVGYWNALGLLAAMGVLLASCFAARAGTPARRAAAGVALVIDLPTLYFTFGRGAWIALAAGLLAMAIVDRRRLQLLTTLLVALLGPAVVVWLASRSRPLTSNTPLLSDATRDGHRLTMIMLVVAAGSAAGVWLLARVEPRFRPARATRLAYIGALSVAVVVGLGATVVRYGAPWTVAGDVYGQFSGRGTGTSGAGANLNRHLFSLAGNGRVDMWKVAWHDTRDHPWLGSGAGTFGQYWLVHRPITAKIRDAHSLYLETLAELGPIGLAVLIAVLVLPLAAIRRSRGDPLAVGAFGAYVAYLVHAGADWDWEVPAVTMTAFICAAALLVAARDPDMLRSVAFPVRAVGSLIVLAVGTLALVGLIANSALSAGTRSTADEHWQSADTQARKAISWAPWSSEGWQLLGESQLQRAQFAAARVSIRKAIAKDRDNWELWLDLALASGGEARRRAAEQALHLNPRSPEIAQIAPALGLRGLATARGARNARP